MGTKPMGFRSCRVSRVVGQPPLERLLFPSASPSFRVRHMSATLQPKKKFGDSGWNATGRTILWNIRRFWVKYAFRLGFCRQSSQGSIPGASTVFSFFLAVSCAFNRH
jgi:hypothetical protein